MIGPGDTAEAVAARKAAWEAGKPAREAEALRPTVDEILDALLDATTQTPTIVGVKARRRI